MLQRGPYSDAVDWLVSVNGKLTEEQALSEWPRRAAPGGSKPIRAEQARGKKLKPATPLVTKLEQSARARRRDSKPSGQTNGMMSD